jgi:hypothetical protein
MAIKTPSSNAITFAIVVFMFPTSFVNRIRIGNYLPRPLIIQEQTSRAEGTKTNVEALALPAILR